MSNLLKGITVFEAALTTINAFAKIIGMNDQSWLSIAVPFIGVIVCVTVLTECKRYLKEHEEVEEYFGG